MPREVEHEVLGRVVLVQEGLRPGRCCWRERSLHGGMTLLCVCVCVCGGGGGGGGGGIGGGRRRG